MYSLSLLITDLSENTIHTIDGNFGAKSLDNLKTFINSLIFDKYNQNELSNICLNKHSPPISDILYTLSDNDKNNGEKLSYAAIALIILLQKTKTMSSEILIQEIFGFDSNKNNNSNNTQQIMKLLLTRAVYPYNENNNESYYCRDAILRFCQLSNETCECARIELQEFTKKWWNRFTRNPLEVSIKEETLCRALTIIADNINIITTTTSTTMSKYEEEKDIVIDIHKWKLNETIFFKDVKKFCMNDETKWSLQRLDSVLILLHQHRHQQQIKKNDKENDRPALKNIEAESQVNTVSNLNIKAELDLENSSLRHNIEEKNKKEHSIKIDDITTDFNTLFCSNINDIDIYNSNSSKTIISQAKVKAYELQIDNLEKGIMDVEREASKKDEIIQELQLRIQELEMSINCADLELKVEKDRMINLEKEVDLKQDKILNIEKDHIKRNFKLNSLLEKFQQELCVEK